MSPASSISNKKKIEDIRASFLKYDKFGQSQVFSALQTLIDFIQKSEALTLTHLLNEELKEIIEVLQTSPSLYGKSKLAVSSALAQFKRFTTLNLYDIENDIEACKIRIKEEGEKYLRRCQKSTQKISKKGVSFIFNGAKVLIHSNSSMVLNTLKSVPENIQFQLYITSSEPEKNQINYLKELSMKGNIKSYSIFDSEAASIMETIDLVLVGAEAVVKNGGIINKVGTLGLAICAKEMNKPMYVLSESFKFSLLYPLNQSDIPDEFRIDENKKVRVDYTPPKYLTLLITDRGLMTPTAVCDELIEMYI